MEEWFDKYFDEFGEGFPMYQLGRCKPPEEIIKIIKECLEKKQDVYELGYIKDDVMY